MTTKKKPVELINHIAFVLDRSTSMNVIRDETIRAFNAQVDEIKNQALKSGQKTYVSLFTFADAPDPEPVIFNAPVEDLRPLTRDDYRPMGWTALLDAVGNATEKLDELPYASKDNASFIMLIITDGEENRSRNWSWFRLGQAIAVLNASDRWSTTFLVPPSCRVDELAKKLYVPKGNIQVWDQTGQGVELMTAQVATGMSAFYTARSSGRRSVTNFFAPDLSGVTRDEVRDALDNVTSKFVSLVPKRENNIRSFIESHGLTFTTGRAFYELVKKEKIQGNKAFLVRDGSGRLYMGDDNARKLMGLPVGGEITVQPGKTGRFGVFVQSTSTNRKLLPGQELLYRVK